MNDNLPNIRMVQPRDIEIIRTYKGIVRKYHLNVIEFIIARPARSRCPENRPIMVRSDVALESFDPAPLPLRPRRG